MEKKLWSRIYAKIPIYYKYGTQNPKLFLMLLFGRLSIVRALVKLFNRKYSLKKYENNSTIFKDIDVDKVIESLQENGYYLGIYLPEEILEEILKFSYSSEINVNNNPQMKFIFSEKKQAEKNYNMKIVIGNYLDASSRCPALKKLEQDPTLLAIAAKYLSSDPVHVRTQLWWCFVAENQEYEQLGELGNPLVLFHYDLDDFHALKFFFYLTDADLSTGAHVCIRGSHKRKKLRQSLLKGHSHQDMVNHYGRENLVNICGQAGLGFAEDPFCFHRGTPPVSGPRLMLQIEFALNDYGLWH